MDVRRGVSPGTAPRPTRTRRAIPLGRSVSLGNVGKGSLRVLVTRSGSDGCSLIGRVLGRCRVAHIIGKIRTIRGMHSRRFSVILVSVGVPVVKNLRTAQGVERLGPVVPVVTLATGTFSTSEMDTVRTNYGTFLAGPLGGRRLLRLFSFGLWRRRGRFSV